MRGIWRVTCTTKLIFASFCCHVATPVDTQSVTGGNKGGNNHIFLQFCLKNAPFVPFLGYQTIIFIPILSIENEKYPYLMPLSYRYNQSFFAEYHHSTNEMQAFQERNASIPDAECKQSMNGIEAFKNWGKCISSSALRDLKNQRKWDKQPHFRWFCKSKILGFKMLFNSTTILSQRTVDECICKEGVTT